MNWGAIYCPCVFNNSHRSIRGVNPINTSVRQLTSVPIQTAIRREKGMTNGMSYMRDLRTAFVWPILTYSYTTQKSVETVPAVTRSVFSERKRSGNRLIAESVSAGVVDAILGAHARRY